MNTRGAAGHKPDSGGAAKDGRSRKPAARVKTRSPSGAGGPTAVHKTAHGLSPKPGAGGVKIRSPRLGVGSVEVRVDPKAGSKAWRELVMLSIEATAHRVADLAEQERSQMLTSVRRRLTVRGGTGPSSDRLYDALHKAGLFKHPSRQTMADRRAIDRTDRGSGVDIPAGNRAALERAFARAEVNKVEILKRPDMLRGEEIGERLNLSRAGVDQRRIGNRLLALELGTKRGVRYPAWQGELVEDAGTRVAFESALSALANVGPWSRYRFFVQPAPALRGRTPIEVLKAGEGEAVRRAAENWARGEQGGH